MERERLWNQVYHAMKQVSKHFSENHSGAGHPDVYPTFVIAVCWFWACLWRWPLNAAVKALSSARKRQCWRGLGYRLPEVIPDYSTVSRRMKRYDFDALVHQVHQTLLARLLADDSYHILLADSSPLDIPSISHDADARRGHHEHFGYRLHTLATHDRLILQWQTCSSNQQELAVMPQLIEQAAARGVHCQFLAADIGYDSEALHAKTHAALGGMLVAPPNDRGGSRTMTRTPLRRAMWCAWHRRDVRRARKKRGQIERTYSILKGPLAIDSLPRHIRHLDRVRRFLDAEIVLYHGHLLVQRLKLVT